MTSVLSQFLKTVVITQSSKTLLLGIDALAQGCPPTIINPLVLPLYLPH